MSYTLSGLLLRDFVSFCLKMVINIIHSFIHSNIIQIDEVAVKFSRIGEEKSDTHKNSNQDNKILILRFACFH